MRKNVAPATERNLEGATLGTPLIGVDLAHGDSTAEIRKSIAEGFPASGMPPWSDRLDDGQVQSLAIFVSEKRDDLEFSDFRIDAPLVIPADTIETERHRFRVETVTSGLHPFPYSIAPLPDGRILLTEKTLGLSIISPHGEQSELIQGAPPAYDDGITVPSLQVELGVYCPRVLGQWFDGIRFYAAASSPTRSRRTWAGLR